MFELQEVSCGEHGNILIEAMKTDGKLEKVGLLRDGLETAFDEVLQTVNIVCQSFVEKLDNIDKRPAPKKCSIEFGIQISTGGRAFVVQASSTANFKVNFEWDL